MFVLVAPDRVGYAEEPDFVWTDPEEFLTLGTGPCCNAESCGCNRCFSGINTLSGTTLAVVKEIGVDEIDKYLDVLGDSRYAEEWGKPQINFNLGALLSLLDTLHVKPGDKVGVINSKDHVQLFLRETA